MDFLPLVNTLRTKKLGSSKGKRSKILMNLKISECTDIRKPLLDSQRKRKEFTTLLTEIMYNVLNHILLKVDDKSRLK